LGIDPTVPPGHFNANPYEYLLQNSVRYTAGFFGHYEVNDHLEFYSNFGFMNDVTNVNVGPSAIFQGSGVTASGGFLVNCGNPFLSLSEQQGLHCLIPTVNLHPMRRRTSTSATQRRRRSAQLLLRSHQIIALSSVAGATSSVRGNTDAYMSYYSTTLLEKNENYLSLAKVQDALLVGGTAANPVCLSGNASCVPYDIFQQGGVTKADAASLYELGTSTGTTTEQIEEIDITGDLTQYGRQVALGQPGVNVAIGGTQRADHLEFTPDAAEQSGDISGFGGAAVPINQSLSVREVYAELNIPLITNMR